MLSIIKQFLPASSRSLHAMHDDINRLQEELDSIYHRIEVADNSPRGAIFTLFIPADGPVHSRHEANYAS